MPTHLAVGEVSAGVLPLQVLLWNKGVNFSRFCRLHHEIDEPTRCWSYNPVVVINPLVWLLRVGVLRARNNGIATVVSDADLFVCSFQFFDELFLGELCKETPNTVLKFVEQLPPTRSPSPGHRSGLLGVRPFFAKCFLEKLFSNRTIDVNCDQTVAGIPRDDA